LLTPQFLLSVELSLASFACFKAHKIKTETEEKLTQSWEDSAGHSSGRCPMTTRRPSSSPPCHDDDDTNFSSNSTTTLPSGDKIDLMQFFQTFYRTRGAMPAFIVSIFLSFGVASTIGIIPEVLSDRYSRLYYHYDGAPCFEFDRIHKPHACQSGSDEAQAASAWGSLLLSLLTLVFNPVVGSMSDVRGRRWMLIASILVNATAPFVLVLMEWMNTMDPLWFYLANSISGVVSYLPIVFAALSDNLPEEYRAPGYALILAAFYGGFAIAPSLPMIMDHFHVSLFSFTLVVVALVYAIVAFPETLPEDVRERNWAQLEMQLITEQEQEHSNEEDCKGLKWLYSMATRPIREMKILNKDLAIRLVAVGSVFSSAVFATDANLVLFYIEDQLDVRDKDIAHMFLLLGIMGVLMQAFLLQPLTHLLGEKGLLVTTFLSGTLHNMLYGLAKDKRTIYIALAFSQLTKTNFPLLSSFASKSASPDAQGQVQGALTALNALGAAIGPLSMQLIYDETKDSSRPGTMFLFAAMLYFIATIAVSFIPAKPQQPTIPSEEGDRSMQQDLEQPLLEEEGHTLDR
jgi:MFS transporter, DHA1 family, tetracycline resistance protein